MMRPPREEAPGAVHHVIPQGNGRRAIVEDDRDRRAYLTRFARLRRELGWFEHAGCLLDTHHHTVVETSAPNLGVGMQRLQGGHSRWLNARHGREGQVFRHRFWSRRIYDDGWFFRACIYIVVNPVAAGLCGHPGEWPWSSYRATAYGEPDAYAPGESRLLGLFGETPGEARRRYRQVVDAAVEIVAARRHDNARGGVGVARRAGRLVSAPMPPHRRCLAEARHRCHATAGVRLKPDTDPTPPQVSG